MKNYIYILILAFSFFSVIIGFFYAKKLKSFFYYSAFLPTIVASWFRGNAGTDTENYRFYFDTYDYQNFSFFSIESFFWAIPFFTKILGGEFIIFSIIHSFLCYFLAVKGAINLDKKMPVVGLAILPVFLIDATFNGLRYGLAFSIFIFIFQYTFNSNKLSNKFILLSPTMVHSSSLLFFLSSLPYHLFFKRFFLFLLIAIFFVIFLHNIDISYFIYKLESYSQTQKPNILSGLSLIINSILYFSIYLLGNENKNHKIQFYICYLLFFISFLISSFTYAGLRFMQIFSLIIPLIVSNSINNKNYTLKFFILLFISIFNIFNFLRQIYFVGVDGGVLFLPYGIL